jgi:uncharacterized protein YfkK (UPF0435 family)
MEQKLEEIEKKLNIIRRFLYDDLEVKNQYLLQLIEELIELLKTTNSVIKQKESKGLSWSNEDSLEVIIKILNKKIKETDNIEKEKLIKQMKKIQAIYSILKE